MRVAAEEMVSIRVTSSSTNRTSSRSRVRVRNAPANSSACDNVAADQRGVRGRFRETRTYPSASSMGTRTNGVAP
jgi:hypothetical protein